MENSYSQEIYLAEDFIFYNERIRRIYVRMHACISYSYITKGVETTQKMMKYL